MTAWFWEKDDPAVVNQVEPLALHADLLYLRFEVASNTSQIAALACYDSDLARMHVKAVKRDRPRAIRPTGLVSS